MVKPKLLDSIQRGINSIRDGKDSNHKAENALRRLCCTIIWERDVTWVNLAEELVSRRLTDTVKDQGLDSPAMELLAELEKCRLNMESLRGFLFRFVEECSSFDICFLAAGFGHWDEMYRAREEGNVVDAIQQVKEIE